MVIVHALIVGLIIKLMTVALTTQEVVPGLCRAYCADAVSISLLIVFSISLMYRFTRSLNEVFRPTTTTLLSSSLARYA